MGKSMRCSPCVFTLLLVFMLASTGVAESVSAQTPGDSDQRRLQQAKEHFEAGSRYYEQGDYEKAIGELQNAYELTGEITLLYNIAKCHERLGDYAKAMRHYRRYLDGTPDLSAADRADVERTLEDMTRRHELASGAAPDVPASPAPLVTGTIRIESDPPGAEVYVDDKLRGNAPLRLDLAAGQHEVVVQVGAKQARTLVSIVGGQNAPLRLSIAPSAQRPTQGTLTVSVVPPVAGTMVHVDGAPRGLTPWVGQVPAGTHQVHVVAPGHTADVQTVVVQAAMTSNAVIALRPASAAGKAGDVDRELPSITQLMPLLAFGGTYDAVAEGTIDDQDVFAEDSPEGEDNLANNYGFGLRFMHTQNPYFGFGLNLRMYMADSEVGGDADSLIDMSPLLKLRVPFEVAQLEHEVYLVAGGGATLVLLGAEGEEAMKSNEMKVDEFAIGYNAEAALGFVLRLARPFGLYLEGGWQMHSFAYEINRIGDVRVEDGRIGARMRQFTASAGFVFAH